MLEAFLISFGVIFVAELGDKSQLMALGFATRYPAVPVLIGITLATGIVHLVSVGIGAVIGTALPDRAIQAVSGVAFIGFALWTLRGDDLDENDRQKIDQSRGSVILTVGGLFMLSELGDKTMLATITLATEHGLFGTWLGSTVGMVAADAIAIVVGRIAGDRLPEKAIRIGAAILFFLIGIASLHRSRARLIAEAAYPGPVRRAAVLLSLFVTAAILVACGADDSGTAAPATTAAASVETSGATQTTTPADPSFPPGTQHLHFEFGPVDVEPGQNSIDFSKGQIPKPDADGWILQISANLRREDGSVPPVDVIHLHHGVWLDASQARLDLPELPRAILRRGRGEDDDRVPARLRLRVPHEGPVGPQLHAPQPDVRPREALAHLRPRLPAFLGARGREHRRGATRVARRAERQRVPGLRRDQGDGHRRHLHLSRSGHRSL